MAAKRNRDCAIRRGLYLVIFAVAFFFVSAPAFAQSTGFDDPMSRTQGGGGDLVPSDRQVEGGSISVGSSAQVAVLFRNESGRPIETGAIQLYPSSTVSAQVSLNQCSQEPIPAGAECAIAINVKGLQAGQWRVELLMRHSGRSRLTKAILAGQIDAGDGASNRFISDIEAIPDEIVFGDLETSQPVIQGVVLRNTTSESIDINAIYIEAAERAGFRLKTDCSTLDPGQACIVVVTWSPVLKGEVSGVLLIEHTGPTRIGSITLTGNYDPERSEEAEIFPEAVPGKGLLVSSQSEVDFGANISTTSAITVSLVNIGDAPLEILDIDLANSDNGLSTSTKGCVAGTLLDPIEACPLTLMWSPVREGAVIDDVQIRHDGARGVMIIPVRGESTGIISQDAKAVRIRTATATGDETSRVLGTTGESRENQRTSDPIPSEQFILREDGVDPASVLDGFIVTSHSPTRSIISGPGGSRIVFDGEDVVIGGFLWTVTIRTSGVEFRSGDEKVLLLFDRSLSSVNRVNSELGGGTAATAGANAGATAAAGN